MTEMISKWFFESFRTLPFVFLYGDQEPRSWGGAFKRPPPSRRWEIQRPSRARVKWEQLPINHCSCPWSTNRQFALYRWINMIEIRSNSWSHWQKIAPPGSEWTRIMSVVRQICLCWVLEKRISCMQISQLRFLQIKCSNLHVQIGAYLILFFNYLSLIFFQKLYCMDDWTIFTHCHRHFFIKKSFTYPPYLIKYFSSSYMNRYFSGNWSSLGQKWVGKVKQKCIE